MSNKTTSLKISTGQYSYYGEHSWITYDKLYIARDQTNQYYFAKFSFNTNGLNFKKSISLKMSHTTCEQSNPWGTSAILTTTALTPDDIYNLNTDANVKAVDGYVSYTHCDSHTTSTNQPTGTVFYYTFEIDNLKPNTTYYVYIRRRIGLTSSDTTNGYTSCYNPCNDSFASYSSLELTYESGGYVNIHNGTTFKKYGSYIYDNTNRFRRYSPYIHNGITWVKYSK